MMGTADDTTVAHGSLTGDEESSAAGEVRPLGSGGSELPAEMPAPSAAVAPPSH